MTCFFCLESHAPEACPKIANLKTLSAFGIIEPGSTAEQTTDALADRMMRYRSFKNGLLGYARERGWEFPVGVLLFDPDYTADAS